MKIIGVQLSNGEYQGVKYSKLKFHCTYPFDDKENHFGNCVEVHSLNFADCKDLLEIVNGDIANLIGLNIDVFYNRYGKANKVVILDKE